MHTQAGLTGLSLTWHVPGFHAHRQGFIHTSLKPTWRLLRWASDGGASTKGHGGLYVSGEWEAEASRG